MALSAFTTRARVAARTNSVRPSAVRPSRVVSVRATPEEPAASTPAPAPAAANVFYGGKEYTEAEVSTPRARAERKSKSICQFYSVAVAAAFVATGGPSPPTLRFSWSAVPPSLSPSLLSLSCAPAPDQAKPSPLAHLILLPPPPTQTAENKNETTKQWAAAVANGTVVAAPAARGGAGATAGSGSGAAAMTLQSAMAFGGPAPELINGRLAMLGFVAAVAAEFSSGQGVLQQWASEPTGIAAAFALFAAASFPPLLAGRKESLGPFTPEAEKLNGRAAMIGFALLLIIEGVQHAPLF